MSHCFFLSSVYSTLEPPLSQWSIAQESAALYEGSPLLHLSGISSDITEGDVTERVFSPLLNMWDVMAPMHRKQYVLCLQGMCATEHYLVSLNERFITQWDMGGGNKHKCLCWKTTRTNWKKKYISNMSPHLSGVPLIEKGTLRRRLNVPCGM